MAESDIIQNLVFQLGQSQSDRSPKELDTHFADVDERTTADLLRFTKAFAELVRYYGNDPAIANGNWSNFFPDYTKIASVLKNEQANTPPQLGLFLAFLELYKQPKSIINNITTRHLDFYYKDVLRLDKKAAIADKVHLLLALKKNVAPVLISPEHLFSAGKDANNVDLIYAPTRETIINAAKVESLRSLFLDATGHGTIRTAAIANSVDGLGGKLAENDKKWSGFGNSTLPAAQIGFAIASPVLRMSEGERKVTISLQLKNLDRSKLNAISLNGAFEVWITGENSWLGSYGFVPTLSAEDLLEFSFIIPVTEKAVVDYNAAIHGYTYRAQAPIVQVLLKAGDENIGYNDFRGVTIESATVSVEVSEITSLQLESDDGAINPKKAFLPFGSQPSKGSRFLVGYPEALAKKLTEIEIAIQWKDAPTNFESHYDGYGVTIANTSFEAGIAFQDSGGWSYKSDPPLTLFNEGDAASLQNFLFIPNGSFVSPYVTEGMEVYALSYTNSLWAGNRARKILNRKSYLSSYQTILPEPQVGFITFILERDFLQETYRKKYVENAIAATKPNGTLKSLNEPYTPKIQSISFSYKASSSRVQIDAITLNDFANSDLKFFHISYFGQTREHGYQRQQIEAQIKTGINTAVPLLPKYDYAGELLIGLSELKAGDSVSVLFQVSEGSADPELRSETLFWFVLCDNYWKPLTRAEVLLDTTNQLLTSGIIQFMIPAEATTQNTILPSALIWIKAGITSNVTAVSQIINIRANAVEVQFVNDDNDPNHLLTALESGAITKFKNGLSAVKTVNQPYASFGGRAVESDPTFYTRVSERLRHKNRCLTLWDYERIILEAFPKVHKVKCIPHAKENSWLAPGHVLIVVVPDLKNKNASNLLEPKVDADTISHIYDYVKKQAGMQVKVKVKNPSYQKIQIDFKVKFHISYEFNYYKMQLDLAITQFLSPWANQGDRDISFGGKIYKSVLLNFVEDMPYVDYVTDFKMYSPIGSTTNKADINEAQPHAPDAILVSAPTHIINPVT